MGYTTLIISNTPSKAITHILQCVSQLESSPRSQELIKFVEGVVQSSSPDIKIVQKEEDKSAISITQAREIKKFFENKPFELENKYVCVFDADHLTREAQNALLKTLEEPPYHGQIYLISKSPEILLTTVRSRCHTINLIEDSLKELIALIEADPEFEPKFLELPGLTSPISEKLELAGEIAKLSKENVLVLLDIWLYRIRDRVLQDQLSIRPESIATIMQVKRALKTSNINVRLAIERIFMYL